MPPALTDPAAVLPGEADILAAVVAAPADETPKLVYADWLDDHGDPARAAYLRAFVAALRTGGPLPTGKPFPESWRSLVGATVVQTARKRGFADRAGGMLGLARPGVDIEPARRPDHSLPVGASRFGGLPDLPEGVEWPRRAGGHPLAFLGQIDLADLAASVAARLIPRAGLLSVFYGLYAEGVDNGYYSGDGPDAWRLFHFPAAVRPRDYPPDLPGDNRFQPHPLSFVERLDLPHPFDTVWNLLAPTPEADWSRFWELIEECREDNMYRLLGWADVPGEMSDTRPDPNLLRIALDAESPGLWGNHLTALHFALSTDDLRAWRLDRTKFEVEWRSS